MADTAIPLGRALAEIVRRPQVLLQRWNWKAAAFSAILRSLIFLITNLHGSHHAKEEAMLTEFVYGTFAAGVAGALTQRLRHAVPVAKTALVMWLGVPLVLLAGQAAVHHAMGTQHLRAGLIASFVFASFATGFNWFAMRRGAFITGEERSFARDLLLVPKLIAQFAMTPLTSRKV
ncbi:MAG: hypothetical protein V4734_02635 [Terriglobus sp.]